MRIRIELELTQGVRRVVLLSALGAAFFGGGLVAHAQSAASTNDTLIGSALHSLGMAVATLQAQVASLQAADHVVRATISPSGSVLSQNGKWVGRVDHPATGAYVVTFAPDAFSAAPTCVVGAVAVDQNAGGTPGGPAMSDPRIQCAAASLTSLSCQSRIEQRPGPDVGLSLICVGP